MKYLPYHAILVALLISCFPVVTSSSAVSTSLPVSASLPPILTSFPVTESIVNANDLPVWVDDFVHAYGGTVPINSLDMAADQLLAEIKSNPDSFVKVKQINGAEHSFLVVNGTPLAIRDENNLWRSVGYKDLSPARMTVGASFAIWTGDYDNDPGYKSVFAENFNLVATDGSLSEYDLLKKIPYDSILTPQEVIDLYDWTDFDKIAQYAQDNNLPIRAMHLYSSPVVGMNTPDWLSQMSDDQLREYLKLHITAILSRADFREASPANEAFYGAGMPGNNFFYSRLGEEYVELAFQTAHELSPDTILILNDNIVYGPHGMNSDDGVWTNSVINGESTVIFNFVKRETAKGLPIDGIGIESHVVASDFVTEDIDGSIEKYKNELLSLMQNYQEIGVDVYFTELDVNIADLPPAWSQQQKQGLKAKIYRSIFEACVVSENCKSVTTWGFSDTATLMLTEGYPYGKGESPLSLDMDYRPFIANYEIKQALFEYWK